MPLTQRWLDSPRSYSSKNFQAFQSWVQASEISAITTHTTLQLLTISVLTVAQADLHNFDCWHIFVKLSQTQCVLGFRLDWFDFLLLLRFGLDHFFYFRLHTMFPLEWRTKISKNLTCKSYLSFFPGKHVTWKVYWLTGQYLKCLNFTNIILNFSKASWQEARIQAKFNGAKRSQWAV